MGWEHTSGQKGIAQPEGASSRLVHAGGDGLGGHWGRAHRDGAQLPRERGVEEGGRRLGQASLRAAAGL